MSNRYDNPATWASGTGGGTTAPSSRLGRDSDVVPTPTNSRIRDGVTYLEGQLTELHGIISSLEARLDTVLAPTPPQPASVNQQKEGTGPPFSHMFDRLNSLSIATTDAHFRLRDILSRIEI